jgi:hypothetical protein
VDDKEAGRCYPFTDYIVKDDKKNEVIILEKASPHSIMPQMIKGHLLFWYGVKTATRYDETRAVFVTNLETIETETVFVSNRVGQILVSPGAEEVALINEGKALIIYESTSTRTTTCPGALPCRRGSPGQCGPS